MSTGVGARIRNKRKELGWSQEELATRMGLKSKSTICKIERGEDNLTADSVAKYADALGCSPGYLMGWEDSAELKAAHDKIISAYIQRKKVNELFEIYEGLSQEKKALFESYLKFLQSGP